MFSLRRITLVATALACLMFGASPSRLRTAGAVDRRYQLVIVNDSEVDVNNLYMSSSHKTSWGPDLLRDDILSPQKSFTISDIIPGEYDFMLVDEEENRCVERDVQIFRDGEWVITEAWFEEHCRR